MASTELFGIGRRLDKPVQEGSVFDKRLPSRNIPAHILGRSACGTWLTAQKDNHGVGFRRNEAEHKDVLGTAVVAFENGIAKRGLRVKLDLLVPRSHQVVNNVR